MMSVLMQKVYDLAEKFDRSLLATDDLFTKTVTVRHEDGTSYHFEYASALRLTHPDYLDKQEKDALAFWDEYDKGLESDISDIDDDDYPSINRSQIGWLIVFTEHNGFHVFACGDLENYRMYERITNFAEFPL